MKYRVFFMHDGRIHPDFVQGVEEALVAFFDRLSMVKTIDVKIENLGHWRHADYLQLGNTLRPWHSFDWYWLYTKQNSQRKGQLDADLMLKLTYSEPWRDIIEHIDVVLVDDDLYAPGCGFVVGLAADKVGAIISTHRFQGIADRTTRIEVFKTAVMHEVGHVYGLPGKHRQSLEESLGTHCTETCIMRQGLRVPHDWERMTFDRFNHGPFCRHCLEQLRQCTP